MRIYKLPKSSIWDSGVWDFYDVLTPDGKIFEIDCGQTDLEAADGRVDVATGDLKPCYLYPREMRFVSHDDRMNYAYPERPEERMKFAYEQYPSLERVTEEDAAKAREEMASYKDVVRLIDVPKSCFEIVRDDDFQKTPLYGRLKMKTTEASYSMCVDLDMVTAADDGYEIKMVDGEKTFFYRIAEDEKTHKIYNVAVDAIKDFFDEKRKSRGEDKGEKSR